MKYFHFEGRINEEILNKFLEFINENEVGELVIIFNSGGGKENLGSVILNIINMNKERVTIISCGIYSCAFYIFYNSMCKRKITDSSIGMYHLASAEMRMQSNSKPSYIEDETVVKNWKESKWEIDFVGSFMTKKELQKFKRGEDVYFTFKRIKEIFPDAEII